jgi:hypothetical protein
MYYLIIASLLLVKGSKKYLLLVIVVLLAGPKVMLLSPCWLIGSILYILVSKEKYVGKTLSILLFTISSIIFVLIIFGIITIYLTKETGNHNFFGYLLFFSWNFRADILLSLLIAINIYGLFGITKTVLPKIEGKVFLKIHNIIRKASNCTYTLYLFHMPLLFLFTSIIPYERTSPYHQIYLTCAVIISTYFIAKQTEWKVNFWRALVANIIERVISNTKKIHVII